MNRLAILAPLLLLVACSKADPAASCNAALDAAIACYEQAYPELGTEAGADDCAEYDDYAGDSGAALIAFFDCQKTVWEGADCSTGDGYLAADADVRTSCADTAAE